MSSSPQPSMDDTAASSTKPLASHSKRGAAELDAAHQGVETPIADDKVVILEKKRKVDDNSSQAEPESAKSSFVIDLGHTGPLAQGQDNAAANIKPFRFLDLPPELRNMIYRLVLVRRHPVYNASFGRDPPPPRPLGTWRVWNEDLLEEMIRFSSALRFSPALPATSPTIYTEARTVLWGQPFLFSDTARLYQFLQEMSPSARVLLRNVTIRRRLWAEVEPFSREEDVIRLLEDAKQMRFFRIIIQYATYDHWDADMTDVQSFRAALEQSNFANGRVHSSSEVVHKWAKYRPGRKDRVITTETWELNT